MYVLDFAVYLGSNGLQTDNRGCNKMATMRAKRRKRREKRAREEGKEAVMSRKEASRLRYARKVCRMLDEQLESLLQRTP